MPLPHLGTDIVHLPRILRLLSRPGYLTRFTSRILTDRERGDFRARFALPAPAPTPQDKTVNETRHHGDTHEIKAPVSRDMASWLAGRFAAKEAARKAVPRGAGEVGWKDVRVIVPAVEEDGKSRKPEIEILGMGTGMEARVSISHDADYVVATVLVGEG